MSSASVTEIEDATRSALAADVWAEYDEEVTVLDYYSIIQVMLPNGRVSLRIVYSGPPENVKHLGWVGFANEAVRDDIRTGFAQQAE